MTDLVKIHVKKNESRNEFQLPIQKNESKNELKYELKNELNSQLKKNELKHELKASMKPSELKYEFKHQLKNELKNPIKKIELKNELKNELKIDLNHPVKKIDSKNVLKNDLNSITTKDAGKEDAQANCSATKKRLVSMTDEEIIQENLKELIEKKSREERKANGRLIAVIVAFLLIFLGIYHAWIRKAGALAGVLVPAVIMLSYGGWLVGLAKQEKRKKAIFEKHLEEVTHRNKAELEQKNKLKKKKGETSLRYEHERTPNGARHGTAASAASSTSGSGSGGGGAGGGNGRKHRNKRTADNGGVNRDLRAKRPSIRQKLFRQNPTTKPMTNLLPMATTATAFVAPTHVILQTKRKRLQRLDALAEPAPLVRMSSAP